MGFFVHCVGLRRDISIKENQFTFMPERSTIEAIHLIRRFIELYRTGKRIFTW